MENAKKIILQTIILTLFFILLPLFTRIIHYSFSGFITLSIFFATFAFISFCHVLHEKYFSAEWKAHMIHIVISILIAIALGCKNTWGACIGLASIAVVLILSPRFLEKNITEEMKE